MTGKGHVATHTATLVTCGCALAMIDNSVKNNIPNALNSDIGIYVNTFAHTYFQMKNMLYIAIGILFSYFGTLLPDCDLETSTIGRVFYIPVEHRTWTHTVYPIIAFFWIGFHLPMVGWIAFGYLTHMIFDTFSVGGVCWLYPFTRYRGYGRHAKVKANHACKCYRTGQISEGVFTCVICAIPICLMVYAMYYHLLF